MKDEEYLDLPYEIVLVQDRDDEGRAGWVAEVEELPGCISQGDTPEEAVEGVRDAMLGWLSVALADGVEIPHPRAKAAYSGRVLIRLARSLHGELARAADREGVSLNQFVTGVLAAAVGWRRNEGGRRRTGRPNDKRRGSDSDLTAAPPNDGGRRRTQAASKSPRSNSGRTSTDTGGRNKSALNDRGT